MGSATREALAKGVAALAEVPGAVDLATGEQLLAAGRVIGGSAQLRAALAEPGAPAEAKQAVVDRVFGGLGPAARQLLGVLAGGRWSSHDDLLAGIEELGLRAVAASAPADADIVAEISAFGAAVTSSAELELAVSSKLGGADAKVELMQKLLAGKASRHTLVILEHLLRQPRGRRVGELLREAVRTVADQSGFLVARVTVASALRADQQVRLQESLAAQYGRAVRINQVVDPAIIGGMRVQIGDDVIDGSIAARLNDLRLQLAS